MKKALKLTAFSLFVLNFVAAGNHDDLYKLLSLSSKIKECRGIIAKADLRKTSQEQAILDNEVIEPLESLLNQNKLVLSDLNLQSLIINDLYLSYVDFNIGSSIRFKFYVGISDSYFDESILMRINFQGGSLDGILFTSARLNNVDFSGAYLNRISFIYASLSKVKFDNAVLDQVNFCQANLDDVSFCKAKFKYNIDFTTVKSIKNADFEGAIGLSYEQVEFLKANGALNVPSPSSNEFLSMRIPSVGSLASSEVSSKGSSFSDEILFGSSSSDDSLYLDDAPISLKLHAY